MPAAGSIKINRVTRIYWLMLLYIIAALIWWFLSLEKQNRQLAEQETANLQLAREQNLLPDAEFSKRIHQVQSQKKRNSTKYIAEGITFLLLILVAAGFVYRSVKRRFDLQLQQQNFLMAVTHELKTPISVARLNLETLQKYQLEPDKREKLIRNTLDETHRLNFLTNNILIASQLEGGRYQLIKEELDLSALLKDSVQDFRKRFPDYQISEATDPDADLKGDPLLLQLLISNLLENAIKYSAKNGRVTARLKKHASSIELRIYDEGPGIPDDEKNRIFDRFYRIGNEDTRKKQGTGLGLYLSKIIAKDHNADIFVTNNEPQGSIFAVVFRI